MRKKIVVGVLLGLLVVVGSARAVKKVERVELRAGDLLIIGHGGFTPEKLPRFRNAPIKLHYGGTLSTVSGELPPVLNEIDFEYDRHGALDTTGLPVCTKGELVATDVPAARRACGDAIVGKGYGTVVVALPEQKPIPASTGITIFNGPASMAKSRNLSTATDTRCPASSRSAGSGPTRASGTATSAPAVKTAICRLGVNSASMTGRFSLAHSSGPAKCSSS